MKTKLPIYALCFVNLIYLVPSVAVSGLVAAFPDVPEERLLLLLTIPNLAGIAGILGVPVLTRWCSRRDLSAAAMALFLLGGGMSLVFHGCLPVLLLGSAVMGVAYGVNSAVYPLLVSMYYQGRSGAGCPAWPRACSSWAAFRSCWWEACWPICAGTVSISSLRWRRCRWY